MTPEHSEDRRNQPFDIVQKPTHYNSHPSGVEAIELCEVLTFNVGNSFKYIYRRDDKINPTQDLQKALWYLKREAARLARYDWLPSILARAFKVNPEFSDIHWDLATRVVESEDDRSLVKPIYTNILWTGDVRTYSMRLGEAIRQTEGLIASYTRPDNLVDA